MKKRILQLFAFSLLAITSSIVLSSSSNGRANAANSGNTGAPGESTTCRTCHGAGFGTSVSISLLNAQGFPVNSYVPGTTYEMLVSINTTSGSPQRYGYQLVSLLPGNAAYNAWSSPSSNTRIASAGGRSYAEHAGKSLTNTFTVDWTAPSAGSGSVRFFAGGAAVNNNGGTGGDGGNTTSLTVQESTNTFLSENEDELRFSIYPNPAVDQLNLQLEVLNGESQRIQLFDLSGKLLLDQRSNQAESTTILDVSGFPKGVYLLQVSSDRQGRASQRLILQ